VVDGFVFSRDAGRRPWLPNWVTKRFIAYRRRAGLAAFRLHDLRHFMATQMLGHGVAVVTVAQRLGHARASTTLNVYGHCIPGADRDAASFIANLITASSSGIEERPFTLAAASVG
jgi:integrase